MDRRSWPWKKKSSDKADKVAVANAAAADAAAAALASTGSKVDQDNDKKPNYVKISVESYTHLTGLEDQVKAYEEQVQSLDGQVQELDEKLSAAYSEMTTKENTVKQHAKVAEEAVSGWEKAEAEALALKNHLEAVTLSKLTAEDRASHLDGALKECMWQIRNLKEEHECKLQEVILLKTKQWDKIRIELEAKMGNLDQELLKVVAENTAISRSLQERSNMLIEISEEKSQVEAEIEFLKSNIESCEREINSLKYELHVVSKELEIRNEEKNMSMRSAEVANKHHMEGVKKIAKLEAECQRLRGLVRKKLPGPAALAQMKLEVENLGRDYGETRNKRSPVKPSSAHLSPVTEFSLDNLQKFQKENEFLAEHLLAMEEETKMLKEALAKRNGELQASRNLCAKTASKLQSLEGQLQISDQQKNYSSHNASNPPSITSMSEDGNDDERSCADSWATAMISELSQFKKENNNEKSKRAENGKHLELMDDFLEMEKLACLSNDSNTNGAITVSDSSNNKISVNHVSEDPTSVKDSPLKQHLDLDPSADHASSDKDLSVVAFGNQADEVLATELQSRISMVFESMSRDTVWGEIEEDLKRIMQEAQGVKFQSSVNCASEEVHCSDAVGRHAELTSEMGVSLSEASNVATEIVHKPSQELTDAISQINDFILFLGKEAMIVPETSSDNNELSQKIAEFSVTFNKISCGSMLLDDFIFDLSHVLAKAGELRFNILGFKNGASEPNSPDCIDKVALPENKMVQKERSEMYQNGHALISSSTTGPEVPDDGNLVSSYKSNAKSIKFSLEEFEELRLEKDNMTTDLVRSAENLEMTKSKLYETEQLLAAANLQLAAAQRSNILAETQLKCMAESYRSLEARAEELETEVNLLRMKTETLENELQDEKRSCQDAVDRCNELQEQLQRNEGCSVCSSAADNGVKMKQDQEYSAATEKLAECQETIFLLGKQLKSLRPQTELIGSYTYNESSQRDEKQLKSLRPQTELMGSHTYNESSQRDEGFTEEKHTSSGMKLREFDQAEMDAPASANLQRVGAESPISSSSQFDAEVDFVRSPISSKYPNNRPTKSTSSSCSSTPTPEKQTRGFSRFFSSKGKNGP